MALVKLESAEVVPVSATQTYMGASGTAGFIVQEYVTLPDGRTWPVRYTIWKSNNILQFPEVGAVVSIMGELSVKAVVSQMDASKAFANISVNNATCTVIGAPKPATEAETAVAVQDIADGLANSLKLPF